MGPLVTLQGGSAAYTTPSSTFFPARPVNSKLLSVRIEMKKLKYQLWSRKISQKSIFQRLSTNLARLFFRVFGDFNSRGVLPFHSLIEILGVKYRCAHLVGVMLNIID